MEIFVLRLEFNIQDVEVIVLLMLPVGRHKVLAS